MVDALHPALAPVLLGTGRQVFDGVGLRALECTCIQFEASAHATHVVPRRNGAAARE